MSTSRQAPHATPREPRPRLRAALAWGAGAAAAAALAAPSLAQAQPLYVSGDGDFVTADSVTGRTLPLLNVSPGNWRWAGPVAVKRDGSGAYVLTGAGVVPVDTARNVAGPLIGIAANYGAIAITPDDSTVLAASREGDAVTPIATADNSPGTPIPVDAPSAVAVAPDGDTAYVATGDRTLTPLDLSTRRLGTPVALAHTPVAVSITPDGALAVVAENDAAQQGYVQVVDLATDTAEPAIQAGERLDSDLAIAPDGTTAYVSQYGQLAPPTSRSGAVLSFDVGSRAFAARPLGFGWQNAVDSPSSVAVGADGRTVFATVGVGCIGPRCNPSGYLLSYDVAADRAAPLGAFQGGVSFVTKPIDVTVAPDPSVSFSVQPGLPNAPTGFDASGASNAGGTITSYRWSFGDGSAPVTTTTPTVSHTYPEGSYTATLTTTNAGGCAARLVYTGQSATCSGLTTVTTSRAVDVTTPPPPPGPARARTAAATGVTSTSALLHGTVDVDGALTTARFEYGTSTSYGTKTPAQTIGAQRRAVPFETLVRGLVPNRRYHYRLVVDTPDRGVSNGQDFTFVTPAAGTVKLGAKTLRVRRGAVRVKVRCDSSTTCRGRLVLQRGKTRYAAGTIAVKPHRTATKRLKLTRVARTRLAHARNGRIPATLTGSFSAQTSLKTAVKIVR